MKYHFRFDRNRQVNRNQDYNLVFLAGPQQRYLALNGDKHVLNPKGEKAGVEFVAKGRFGPYFLWLQDFCLG